MLEREHDLARCLATLHEVVGGRGRFLVIEGPAGIGKTALLRAFLDSASGTHVRVLSARATELDRDLPFGAVRQLFDPILARRGRRRGGPPFRGAATITRQLFTPDHAGAGTNDPYAMLHGLYWVTSELAERQALVLAIDDAHWLDQPSVRYLSFLQPRLVELPVLVLLATRPLHDEPDDDGLARIAADPETCLIRPQPLSRHAVAAMVLEQVGQTSDETADDIAGITGGNPFYLVELLRDVRGTGFAEPAALRRLGPRSIAQAIRFRGRGSSTATTFARALAVLGDGSALQDISHLAGIEFPLASTAADALTADGVLARGSELAFAHPIVRTAIYEDIPPRERAAMHGRAARLISSRSSAVDRVAIHLLSTEPTGDPWVVDVLRNAALGAGASGAPEVAARYLRRALEEPPESTVRALVLAELGHAEESLGSQTALPHFIEAQQTLVDPAARADTAIAAALALSATGDEIRAVEMLDAAAAELSRVPRDTALALEARVAIVSIFHVDTARRYLARLDRLDGAELAGHSFGEQLMLCVLGCRRAWLGDDARAAARLVRRGLTDDLIEQRGPGALEIEAAGVTLVYADDHEAAGRIIRRLATVSRNTGSRFGYALTSLLRSALGNRRGDLSEAETAAREVLGIVLQSGQPVFASVGGAELIVALTERGAFEQAHDELAVMGLDAATPADPMYTAILSARGRLHLAEGDVHASLADLEECGRRCELLGNRSPMFLPWRGEAARAQRALGQRDIANDLAQQHLADARRWGTPAAIGAAERVMGLVSDTSDSVGWLRSAVESLEGSPARLDYAKALVDLGSAHRRAGHRSDARAHLTNGLDIADRCGALPLSDHARTELAALGVRPRRSRLTGVEALTASERRVAQMAAEGMTNVEIAQTLFVTRKTVEKHLGNAYSKLGVTSRSALGPYFTANDPG